MRLTDQQENIISSFSSGESLAVLARAGTGKTSTIEAAYRKSNRPGLYVTFNKRNADEAKLRMPETAIVRTMNALGHKAWWQYTRKKLEINTWKISDIFKASKHFYQLEDSRGKDLVAFVRAARVMGVPPGIGPTKKPTEADWQAAADFADIEDWEELIDPAYELLQESCKQALQGLIDFDDQIYCSVLFSAPFEQYPLVTVDEAQDLSGLQHEMIRRILARNGQLVIVGDPAQAIYAFRGASNNSFAELQAQFNLPTLPLSKSFRCPRNVIKEAQRYVPDIEAAGEIDGEVKIGLPVLEAGRTILSRTNTPIVGLAMRCIRQRKPVNFLGRDFTNGLLSLHKKTKTKEGLREWLAKEIQKNPKRKRTLEDKFASMCVLHDSGIPVEIAIKDLDKAAKAGQGVTLSTIHKAKGLEWNHVTYLDYDKEWFGDQEGNIKYVGVTRAKQTLVLGESE